MSSQEAEKGPDRDAALEQYRDAAPGYDRHMRRFARWQRMAIERLRLQPGETVIDVGCGTGLTFPLLETVVGPSGAIIGIELSPEMAAQARQRVGVQGCQNVILIEAPVEEAEIHATADAALFSFTHDILQSPLAVANVVAHLKSGARVASVGAKFAGGWSPMVNFFVRRSACPYVTGFDVKSLALGGAYVASALVADEAPVLAAEEFTRMRGAS
jgi:ubiquinone/menaquinone biosynthesis C-methylase UbiE